MKNDKKIMIVIIINLGEEDKKDQTLGEEDNKKMIKRPSQDNEDQTLGEECPLVVSLL